MARALIIFVTASVSEAVSSDTRANRQSKLSLSLEILNRLCSEIAALRLRFVRNDKGLQLADELEPSH